MTTPSRSRLHYAGAIVWLVLTVSLATWWMIFGMLLGTSGAIRLERVQRMFTWEGAFLLTLLVSGGVALVVSVHREQVRQRQIEAFFMAFTHDLKTALASLQLQAESLQEDLAGAAANPNLERLLKDSRRLQLQLENSLYFAQPDGGMFLETLSVQMLFERAAEDWPELTVRIGGDAPARADRRAMESVVRNLLQNSVIHGAARSVSVGVQRLSSGRIRVTAADDGRGAPPEVVGMLGRPFSRPVASSGTGVGLFVSQQLVRRMHGDLTFSTEAGAGFTALLDLPAAD
jgi:hypothetical protein